MKLFNWLKTIRNRSTRRAQQPRVAADRAARLESLETRCLLTTIDLSVSAATGTEAGQTVITVTATAASAVSGDQTVDLAVTGPGITTGDYSLTDGDAAAGIQIKILSGQTTGTVTFTIVDDLQFEGDETATLTISNPSAGISLGTTLSQDIAITDNDTDTAAVYSALDDGNADSVRLVLNAGALEIRSVSGDVLLDSRAISALIGGVTIQGADGEDDTLTLDFATGNPVPAGGLTFNGGTTGFDVLIVTGGTTTTVTHSLTNANDGSITLAGALEGTINYTGLEPITDNLNATDRVFTFNGGAETITVSDNIAADGKTLIDSTLSESVYFTNPTTSLTINAGTGANTVTINALDAGFSATLTINGGDDADTVTLTTATVAATVNGGAGADSIAGSNLADSLSGGAGNDTIAGNAGNDTINGGDDNDSVNGNADDDSILGEAGADTLNGDAGGDFISGEAGADNISGGTENDSINGGTEADSITGDAGTDTITGDAGNDTINGGDDNDSVNGNADDDSILGGAGADTLNGDAGADFISGEAGADNITGGTENDSINGGTEADSITGDAGNDTILGDAGNDTINGNDGTDSISGEAGDDNITGDAGADTISGGTENDSINGGAEADSITGDAGNDTILGDAGNDTINGNDGNDSISGEAGADSLSGDADDDTIDGGTGSDSLFGNDGKDQIFVRDIDTANVTVRGGANDDIIFVGTLGGTISGEGALDIDGDEHDTFDIIDVLASLDVTGATSEINLRDAEIRIKAPSIKSVSHQKYGELPSLPAVPAAPAHPPVPPIPTFTLPAPTANMDDDRVVLFEDVTFQTTSANASLGNVSFNGFVDTATTALAANKGDLFLNVAGAIGTRFEANIGDGNSAGTRVGLGSGTAAEAAVTVVKGNVTFADNVLSARIRGDLRVTVADVTVQSERANRGTFVSYVDPAMTGKESPVISIPAAANNVTVTNLTIINGRGATQGDGVVISADTAKILNNTITANARDGIRIAAGTGNHLSNNSTYNNGKLGINLVGGTDVGPELSNGVTINDKERAAIATTLAADPGAAGTTLTLASVVAFLDAPLPLVATIGVEKVLVVGVNPANSTVDVLRGVQGTVAAAHGVGSVVTVAAVATSDGDAGANNLQNTPEILYAYFVGTDTLEVVYHVPSTNNAAITDYDLEIEFFLADFFDRNGDGNLLPTALDLTNTDDDLRLVTDQTDGREGATFLGNDPDDYTAIDERAPKTARITLTGAVADLLATDDVRDFLTSVRLVATATDASGNTSEFSRAAVINPKPGLRSDVATERTKIPASPNPLPDSELPQRFFFDELTLTGFLFAAGPDSDGLSVAETPRFITDWDTKGDSQQPPAGVLPSFFDNVLGVYNLDSSAGNVGTVAPNVLANVTLSANITATTTTFAVSDVSKLSAVVGHQLLIDREVVTITGFPALNQVTVTRAAVPPPVDHLKGAMVTNLNHPTASYTEAALGRTVGLGGPVQVITEKTVTTDRTGNSAISFDPGSRAGFFLVRNSSIGNLLGTLSDGTSVVPNPGNAPSIDDPGSQALVMSTALTNQLNADRAYAFFSVANANPDRNASALRSGAAGDPLFQGQAGQVAKYHIRTELNELTGQLIVYWEDTFAPRNTGFGSSDFDQGYRDGEDAIVTFTDPFLRPVRTNAGGSTLTINLTADAALGLKTDADGSIGVSQLSGTVTATLDAQAFDLTDPTELAAFELLRANRVSMLIINGGAGNNTINVAGLKAIAIDDLGDANPLNDVRSAGFSSLETVQIFGNGGNDTITGSELRDNIDGGEGNDSLLGGLSNDSLLGGDGNDRLEGQDGNDSLSGGDGVDSLFGQNGDDSLGGGLDGDNDSLVGGTGTDTLVETTVGLAVTLTLTKTKLISGAGVGAEMDSLSQIEQASLTGTAGGDSINASGFLGSVTLLGLGGGDSLTGGSKNDSLDGGDGLDTLRGGSGNDVLNGGLNGDSLFGDGGNDSLSGGQGTDTLQGGSGTDVVIETVIEASGSFALSNTTLVGSALLGTDGLTAVESAILTGDATDNTISAAGFTLGKVTLIGGTGIDVLTGGTKNDSLSGGAGNDILNGGFGNDTLQGGAGNDVMNGGAGNDGLSGQDGDDQLKGGIGNDTIIGGLGSDQLEGEAGNDTLIGGFGLDVLIDDAIGTNKALGGQGKVGPQRFGLGVSDGEVISNAVIDETFSKLFAFE